MMTVGGGVHVGVTPRDKSPRGRRTRKFLQRARLAHQRERCNSSCSDFSVFLLEHCLEFSVGTIALGKFGTVFLAEGAARVLPFLRRIPPS